MAPASVRVRMSIWAGEGGPLWNGIEPGIETAGGMTVSLTEAVLAGGDTKLSLYDMDFRIPEEEERVGGSGPAKVGGGQRGTSAN